MVPLVLMLDCRSTGGSAIGATWFSHLWYKTRHGKQVRTSPVEKAPHGMRRMTPIAAMQAGSRDEAALSRLGKSG